MKWEDRHAEAVANGEASPPNPCIDYKCADYDEENDTCFSNGGCGRAEELEIDPDTLSQSTGLKDKNGRLIFEGDIVNTEIAPGFNQNVKVVWHNGSWCLHVPYWETNGYDYWLLGRNNTNAMCVVVGNVHDNPELLKEE